MKVVGESLGSGHWTPAGRAGIERVVALKDELASLLDEFSRIEIVLDGLEAVDVTFIQLLYAARRSALAKGKELRLVGRVCPEVARAFLIGGFLKRETKDAAVLEAELIGFAED